MDESKQTGSRMAAEGSGSASMACGAVHRQTPEAGARCVNRARRDLCGGYPVTGIPTATLFCEGRFFSSHLVAVVCNHLLFLQKQGNFRRIAASPENRYLIKCNILKYSAFILSGVIMNTGLRQVLRYAGVPVDAAEPVRRQFGSRLILIVTVALLPLLIVDVPQWLFVLSQIIWGSGMYIGISVASDKPDRR